MRIGAPTPEALASPEAALASPEAAGETSPPGAPARRTERPSSASVDAPDTPNTRRTTLIEWGWVVVGATSPDERAAIESAREIVHESLERRFPAFEWRLPLVARPGAAAAGVDEPVTRLLEGAREREGRAWDFALVVTPQDLRAYYQTFALGVPSRGLAVAVLSLARITPFENAKSERSVLARRVAALALHLFGDLNGLWHRDDPGAVMHPPDAASELDAERKLEPRELERLGRALEEVADLRLEEAGSPRFAPAFYLKATWTQAREIASAVVQARPWEFPLRLSRLTAAALSALFILLLTAEVWDLGTSQRPATVAALSGVALAVTTPFILLRQKLILRRTRLGLSERIVVANVSASLIVLLGMLTTYAFLFLLTLVAGATLYGPELVERWAPAAAASSEGHALPLLAGLVASLGLAIGSLGASFEGSHYFQHVIYADEET